MPSSVDVLPEQPVETTLGGFLEIDFQDAPKAQRSTAAVRSAYYQTNKLLTPNSLFLFVAGVGTALSAGIVIALMV